MNYFLFDYKVELINPVDVYQFNDKKEKLVEFCSEEYSRCRCTPELINFFGPSGMQNVLFKSRTINHVTNLYGLWKNGLFVSKYFKDIFDSLCIPPYEEVPIKVKIKDTIHDDYSILFFYQDILGYVDFERSDMICGQYDYNVHKWEDFNFPVNEEVNSCQDYFSFISKNKCRVKMINMEIKEKYKDLDFLPSKDNGVAYTHIVTERFKDLMKEHKIKKIKFLPLQEYLMDFKSRF